VVAFSNRGLVLEHSPRLGRNGIGCSPRPACFESTVDAISNPSYDFFWEMKALGIPTFLQVLQVLQPDLTAQMGVQASADVTAAVRSYMGRF
jgi:hypothetical protein